MSDYNEDLKIDFAKLDINWRDHSANYMKWGEKWVNAITERDRIKEALEVLKAELSTRYRQELHTDKKPTEAAITAAITSNEEYQAMQQTLIDATEAVNLHATTKVAFEHRKKALESTTQLWIAGYLSSPNIPAEIKEQFKKEDPELQKAQRATLNKNERLQKRKPKPITRRK